MFGGNRDYIWNQFNEFTATAHKENDLSQAANMTVLTDNAENYGYQSEFYTVLYSQVDGNERFFWQRWLKRTIAKFLVQASLFKLRDFDAWDYKLQRYLTLFFR